MKKILKASLIAFALSAVAVNAAPNDDPVLRLLDEPNAREQNLEFNISNSASTNVNSNVALPSAVPQNNAKVEPLQDYKADLNVPATFDNNAQALAPNTANTQGSAQNAEQDAQATDQIPEALRALMMPGTQAPVTPFGMESYTENPFATAQDVATTPPDNAQQVAALDEEVDDSVPFSADLSFAKLGVKEGISLKAGMLATGLDFTLPLDKVITSAKLTLQVEVTENMARRGSHLEMTLNGQPIGSIPLNRHDGPSIYEVSLPFEYFGTANNFSFKVSDDEEFTCMIDYTRRFVISILPESSIHLEGHRLQMGTDLSLFPLPFFDPFDVTKSALSIVLPQEPTEDEITAASLLSSWFGIRSDYRGIKFNVLTGETPRDNAIVIGHPGDRIGAITLPNEECVSIVEHPLTPAFKLVLISAKEFSRFRDAIAKLTSGKIEPNTKKINFGTATIAQSLPYDAPKWIATDHKVYLSEMLSPDQSLISTGVWHQPINISFRASPDLYQLYGEPAELNIKYNFPLEQWIDEDHSWLNVELSGNFLENVPVNKIGFAESIWRLAGGDARKEQHTIPVQPYMIYGDNNLALYFDIKLKQGAPCSVLHDNNLKSAILDNSYIDLTNTVHFAKMPNLSYFVGASYPFTKYADMSQTLLLLPSKPSAAEIQTLLDLSARTGKATGVPIWYANTVLGAQSLGQRADFDDQDILAVSSLEQQTFMEKLLEDSAFIYSKSGNDLSVRQYGPFSLHGGMVKSLGRLLSGDYRPDNNDATRYLRSNMSWRGFVSLVSPWNQSRIIVLATGSDDKQLIKLSDDLDNDQINRAVAGDLTVISGVDSVRSFKVGDTIYSGNVSNYFMFLYFLGQHEIWLACISFLLFIILGVTLSHTLKRRAQKRLQQSNEGKK